MHFGSSPHVVSVRAALAVALAVTLALAGGVWKSASAHPFGDPETAVISLVDTDTLRVRWAVGMLDDYTYLALDLDLIPTERVMLDGAVDPVDTDPALLADAPAFERYLLDHISVSVGDQACPGRVQPVDDLADDGVDVDFDCPSAVSTATVTISMLTDLSEYYTTVATGPAGAQQVYAGSQLTHDWSFGPTAATAATANTGRDAALQIGLVLGVLGLAGAMALGITRHRRRRGSAATSMSSPPTPHEVSVQ